MLWDENIKSVSHRYGEENTDKLPGVIGETYAYDAHENFIFGPDVNPVAVLKACRCYAYQSCEHPGWEDSRAKALIDNLKDSAISSLPGYEEAEWGNPTLENLEKTMTDPTDPDLTPFTPTVDTLYIWQRLTDFLTKDATPTGSPCFCRLGLERDNCPNCEGTGGVIDWVAFRRLPLLVDLVKDLRKELARNIEVDTGLTPEKILEKEASR